MVSLLHLSDSRAGRRLQGWREVVSREGRVFKDSRQVRRCSLEAE